MGRRVVCIALLLCSCVALAAATGSQSGRQRSRATQLGSSGVSSDQQTPLPPSVAAGNSTANASAPTNSSSNDAGKDSIEFFQDFIKRIRENVAAEARVARTSAMLANASCFSTLRRLNKTLDVKLTQITAANHTLIKSIRKLRAATYHLNHLRPLLNRTRKMYARVNGSLFVGNQHSARQVELAQNKSKDAQVVIAAVQALFSMLSQLNGYNSTTDTTAASARFREQIVHAQSQVKDAQVLRFLETTLQSMSELPATLPSKEDIAKLRLLLSLLKSQMLQYAQTVTTDVGVETGLWNTRASQLKQQLVLIQQNIDRRAAQVKVQRNRGRLARQAIKASNETLTGSVYRESVLLKTQIRFYQASCRNQSDLFAAENRNRKVQEKLLLELARTQFGNADNDMMSRLVTGLKLPKVNMVDSTGKRCCKYCESGKKPCGDKCIMEEETCTTVGGCACEPPPPLA